MNHSNRPKPYDMILRIAFLLSEFRWLKEGLGMIGRSSLLMGACGVIFRTAFKKLWRVT